MNIFTKKEWGKWTFVFFLLFYFGSNAFSQEKTVSGRVTAEEDGNGLPGVNIIIKGTTQGTITDANGDFSLSVPGNNATLIFSFIGFLPQEVAVGSQEVMDIALTLDISTLQEVVVVGYGTQKKADVTGAIATVKGDKLTVGVAPNLAANLAGKLTGVITSQQTGLPGFEQTEFRIRGASSLNNNSALIIVDGVERSLSRINPNEIESITVLKDAASAAIYGARAANGVVLVTTKRGGDRPAAFNYSGSYGWQKITKQPELMDALQYATLFNEAQLNTNPNLDPDEIRFSDQDIADIRNGVAPNTNWYDAVLDDGAPIQQHNLSVDGGNELTKYFVSFGLLDQKGLYETSGFKTYSLRSNIDSKVGKNLTLGLDLAGRIESTENTAIGGIEDNPGSNGFGANRIFEAIGNANPTFAPFVDGDGDGQVDDFGYDGRISSALGRAIGSGKYTRENNVVQSSITARYDLPWVEGFHVKGRYSYDATFNTTRSFQLPFTFYQPDGTGGFTPSENLTSPVLNERRRNFTQQTVQFSLGYDKSFGVHDISALLLYEQVQGTSDLISGFRDGFLGNSVDQFLAGSPENALNEGSAGESARIGYVGRVNYGLKDKYLFQANFRYDGSHKFREGNRFGFFPALSAAWRVSEEDFFPKNGFLSSLKLRASWGKFGNDRVNAFQYLSLFDIRPSVSAVGGITRTGIRESVLENPGITWEKATGTDIGFELGFAENKIEVEFDYFNKKTTDILIPVSGDFPDTFGGLLPDQNFGETENRGVEALVRYVNDFGDFHLSTSANITYARSKVIEKAEAANINSYFRETGQPIGVQRGYQALGLFQTREELNTSPRQDQDEDNPNSTLFPGDIKYADINDDGVIDGDDRTIIGKGNLPEVVFGYNLNISYKGIGLAANFQGATGFTRYAEYAPFVIEGNSRALLQDSWRPGNEGARFPRLTIGTASNNGLRSSFWLEEITYLRLRNVELSYTIPNQIISKIGIENVRVFISGNNLLTISNVEDIDPEGPSTFRPYFPQLQSFQLGLNLGF